MSEEPKNQLINEDDDQLIFADEDDEELVFTDEDGEELISTNTNDNKLIFHETKELPLSAEDSWKILVVDDETEIHDVTKLVLNDF
ncbi:MAG TPA: adenylate/guanylate cyclase domain-containing response regulator, partial [Coleofasciculaceae cyanobacterium]